MKKEIPQYPTQAPSNQTVETIDFASFYTRLAVMEEGVSFYSDTKQFANLLLDSGKFIDSTQTIETIIAKCNEALYAYSLPQKEEILSLFKQIQWVS